MIAALAIFAAFSASSVRQGRGVFLCLRRETRAEGVVGLAVVAEVVVVVGVAAGGEEVEEEEEEEEEEEVYNREGSGRMRIDRGVVES